MHLGSYKHTWIIFLHTSIFAYLKLMATSEEFEPSVDQELDCILLQQIVNLRFLKYYNL